MTHISQSLKIITMMDLIHPPLFLFDRLTETDRNHMVDGRTAMKTEEEKRLFCAGCRHVITNVDERIVIQGGHEHSFTNPHGYRFNIGCFGQAAGCGATGEETDEWSWFSGFRWRIALCANCQQHLGWLFRASDEGFYGLILNRLTSVGGKAA